MSATEEPVALLQRRLGAISMFHGMALGFFLWTISSKTHWANNEWTFLFITLFLLGTLSYYLQRMAEKIVLGNYDRDFWYFASCILLSMIVNSAILVSWFLVNWVIWFSILAAWVLSYLFVVFNGKIELDKE